MLLKYRHYVWLFYIVSTKKMSKTQKNLSFGQRLRATREGRTLSAGQLAKKIGLSNPSQISRYETDKSLPNVRVLNKLAQTLTVDLHWLITGAPSPTVQELTDRVKPYLYAHLSDITIRLQQLERERRELCTRNVQGEPRPGGIKDLEKLIADCHAYCRVAYQDLDRLVGMQSQNVKEIEISYDLLRKRLTTLSIE